MDEFKIEITLDTLLDRDLMEHFASVEGPARPYVAKQLIRLALTTNVSPFIKLREEEKVMMG